MVSAVDLPADQETARNCVPALKHKQTEDCKLHRKVPVWSLAETGWPTAGGQATGAKCRLRNRLGYVVLLSQRQTISRHVMSRNIILVSYHTYHSVVSHITCGHCTYCVSCHTGRGEDAIITGLLLLLFCCCLLIVLLSVTADDYRTFRRHQYFHIQDIFKSLTT
jgi:hypothetical protein